MEYENKIAVVTGAARGIGKECSLLFAKQGAHVVVADIDEMGAKAAAEEFNSLGYKAEGYGIDFSKVKGIRKLAGYITEKHKHVHIIVNNAGIYRTTVIEDVTESEWDFETSINLKGGFFLIQSLLPLMKKQKYGKIVNLGSVAGRNGGVEAGAAYAASKAGVIGLTRTLALKLAPYNINVNCVAPGPTKTRMITELPEEKQAKVIECIPLKRFGDPREIAYAVEFLTSYRADFITGVVLDVNGGMYLG